MRRWEATFKGHEIRIEAGVFSKRLFIEGKLKAVSGFGTSAQLLARIEEDEGAGEPLIAKIQGLWPSGCDLVTHDDVPTPQKFEQDPQGVKKSKDRAFNVIRGEGPTSGDAWKEVLEGFRRKFPNLASYDNKELEDILTQNGVKFAQVFGEKGLVEINLENQTRLGQTISETLSQFPSKDSR